MALALNLVFPGLPVTILVAGVMSGAVYALFRTPLMVVLLTSFMLAGDATLIALIVLAVATVMIALPLVQRRAGARRARHGARATGGAR